MLSTPSKHLKIWLVNILLALNILLGIALFSWRTSKRNRAAQTGALPYGVMGLSEAEVAARLPDFDPEAQERKEDRQFMLRAIRLSLTATYNIDLFGIAIILFLLGNPRGMFDTSLVILLNLVLNVFQQVYAKNQIKQIVKNLRPQANVIRDGHLQSIDPIKIVAGDYVIVNEGDEFLVDGKLIGENSILVEMASTKDRVHSVKVGQGDVIQAGSYCLEGYTIYIAQQPGIERYKVVPHQKLQLLLGELTPLERFMEIVFRVLFGIVIIFCLLLLIDALITKADLISTVYREAFSTIFGIAPTSLFFALIITYTVGVLRISDRGALVYDVNSIETMANASILCISNESLSGGIQVNIEPIESSSLREAFSENLIRRILGDFVHSMPSLNATDQMLFQAFPGHSRSGIEIAPLFLEQGWRGATFNDPHLRGTFVLGQPEVIKDHLAVDLEGITEEMDRDITNAQRKILHWLKDQVASKKEENIPETTVPNNVAPIPETPETHPDQRQRLLDRMTKMLSPMEDQAFFERKLQETDKGLRLTFAYLPEPQPLFNSQNRPNIPNGLIPLANLNITENLHPEAENSIQSLINTGLQVKILSTDPPEEMLSAALELDLSQDDFSMRSGPGLSSLNENETAEVVKKTTLIGDLTPSQKADVVKSMRSQSEGVIMVGNSVTDIPALQQANLRVVLRRSAQAALKLTDIVLLGDSLAALPHVMITSQRIVNGILDVFKLYLSQTVAQLFLILFLLFLGMEEYPIHPTQAGTVSIFSIAIPAMFLPAWSAAGRISDSTIRRQLAHFIIPAALTTAFLAWGVFTFFMYQTQNREYAELAVTFAFLIAGWLRAVFLLPPSPFWVGGAPLRGDKRVIRAVLGSILLFGVAISIPFFQKLLRTYWLPSPFDYLWIALFVTVWAFLLRAIWRSRWFAFLIQKL